MDLTIGQLLPLPTQFVPANTLLCNGQLVAAQDYPALFQSIGFTFGEGGNDTFGIPNVPPLKPLNGPPINWYVPYDGNWRGTSVKILAQVSPLVLAPSGDTQLAQDTVPCNGSITNLSQDDLQSLLIFSLLGTRFGGNGVTTFAYPDIAPMPGISGQSFPYYMFVDGYYPGLSCDAVTPLHDSVPPLDTFLGTIAMFPYLPAMMNAMCGVALCRGQLLPLGGNGQWDALFSLLGTRYGGDGKSTFGLPNLPDGPGGLTYAMVTAGIYPSQN